MAEATRRGLYVPLDVNYRDDPKIIGAGPDAELVYLRSLVLAKRLTDRDGHIHRAHLLGLCGDFDNIIHGEDVPDDIAKALIDAGLWVEDGDGWRITAWLKHNPSAAEIEESRGAEASRKAAWRKSRQDKEPRDEESHGTEGDATPSKREEKTETETETEGSKPSVELVVQDSSPPATDAVSVVFAAWQESTGKRRAVLDPKRRRLIGNALRLYPVEDLTDAVRGWQHSPHHRGENERRTVYNDLDLLLRDTKHIEEFRDLERGEGRPAPPKMPVGTDMSARWLVQQEWIEQQGGGGHGTA